MKIIFLLEEPSMKAFLESFLPRLVPGLDFLCIRHEGKQDLEKSIPRKLRAFQQARFVIVRDNDGAQCKRLKARLRALCKKGGRPDALIRIVCQELEAWYLGALSAVAEEYGRPDLKALDQKRAFRDPDKLGSPSQKLVELVPGFRKIDGARRMGQALPVRRDGSRSRSFQVFVEGVQRLATG